MCRNRLSSSYSLFVWWVKRRLKRWSVTCCYQGIAFLGRIYRRCDIRWYAIKKIAFICNHKLFNIVHSKFSGVSWLRLDHQWGRHWLHFQRTIQQQQIHWINLQHSLCHLHRITFQRKIIHKNSRIFHLHTIERTRAIAV